MNLMRKMYVFVFKLDELDDLDEEIYIYVCFVLCCIVLYCFVLSFQFSTSCYHRHSTNS